VIAPLPTRGAGAFRIPPQHHIQKGRASCRRCPCSQDVPAWLPTWRWPTGGRKALSGCGVKILQLHTRYRQPGGEDAVVRAEADLLRSAGHTVFTYEVRNPESRVATAAALASAAWNASAKRTVRALTEKHQPDVAHVHNTWFALSPSVFAGLRRAGVPVVATLHNYRLLCTNGLLFRDGRPCEDCVGTHPWHGVRHRCYRNSALASSAVAGTIALHRARGTWERDVDLFLALTDSARQRFIAGGLPADRIRVKPNFAPDPGPRRCAPQDSDVVLFVGRLSAEKGIEEFLLAWAAANPAPLRLRIVGDGPLQRRAKALGAPRVELLGRLPSTEVRRLMLGARTLVFPSRSHESFGLVVVEAMAAGLPVVAADVGGVRELISSDGYQHIVPPAHDRWVTAMRSVVEGSWLNAAGETGRRRYEARFSASANLEALEAAYRTVATGRLPGPC
jgi:glycosyltransferase involved in cell wall biosynthesis